MRLIASIPPSFANAINSNAVFSEEEQKKLDARRSIEQPPIGIPRESCNYNLFFGFFFDGTRHTQFAV